VLILGFGLLAGDGLARRPSGLVGSVIRAIVVTAIWRWATRRPSPARPQETPTVADRLRERVSGGVPFSAVDEPRRCVVVRLERRRADHR
jgi:hypothetical protein